VTSDELNWRFIHAPKAFLYLSIALHLTIPIFFGTVAVLDKLGWSLLGPRKPQKEIYQEFIQVDMVGLPDQLISQQNDVDTSLPITDKAVPPTKVEESPPPPPVETKGEENGKTQEDVMAELEAKKQAEAAAAKVKAEKERKDKENAEREKVLKQMEADAKREAALKELAEKGSRGKLKGNILSKGTSAKGLIGTAKDRYISEIAAKLKRNFEVFPWHKKKGLVGTVFLKITPKGELVGDPKIVKASKDSTFDSALKQAVRASAPFPNPDEESLKDGITIEFHPDD